MKFYPYEKEGGGGTSFSLAEEGAQHFLGYFSCSSLRFKPYRSVDAKRLTLS